ncbi:putative serine/threonine-protein kinase roco5 [Frankliniella fusca]|uniref:Serine/threonine-protein kinase roco5 n=1 Tax=Frankliniella fusca TaxID=407009 RepID=A0AAE1GRY7_9NEOP|nr:putative serine/threonine-protein kinase roco5 [Frankliniella fusca]
MTAARKRRLAVLPLLLLAVAAAAPAVRGCDCGKGAAQPAPENSLQRPGSGPRWGGGGAPATSTLDDILTPQLVQSYLALQLHRAALDLTRDTSDARLGQGAGCPPRGPCRGPDTPLRRSRRFATKGGGSDVPVVSGLAGLPLPSSAPLVSLHKNDESNDVPVFKGNHEGTPLIRVVTPPPPAVAAARSAAGATTAPTVPVVKGTADPAHPGPGTPKVSSLLPGDLQLTPEEEEALAVLLEGRHGGKKPTVAPTPLRPRPTPRPALRPTRPPPAPAPAVSSVSGKVGGKAQQPVGVQQRHHSSGNSPAGSSGGEGGNCCSQKRLLQELERQLSILRQLNADHLREEWVRASYPSPYYPYLHNLPVHPARGYDAVPGPGRSPALLPTYFLPSSAGSRRRSPDPALLPPWRTPDPEPEVAQRSDCEWPGRAGPGSGDAEGGSRLDDKTHFSQQQREADDLRGDDPQDDVGVDPKIGEPVDFEVR